MKHRTLAAIVAIALTTATAAVAQDQSTTPQQGPPAHMRHAPNPNRQTKELTKKLGLSSDQATQIEPILADRDQKMQALMANTSLDPKSMREQRRSIATDTDQRLSAVLTDAQKTQYEQMKAARRHQGQPMAPAAPPAL